MVNPEQCNHIEFLNFMPMIWGWTTLFKLSTRGYLGTISGFENFGCYSILKIKVWIISAKVM